MTSTKKKDRKEGPFGRMMRHRPWLFCLLVLTSFLGPAGFGRPSQAPETDSLKTGGLDRCGNPKAVSRPVQDQTQPTPPQRSPEWSVKLTESGIKGTAYFFLGSLCPCTDAHKHSIMELMSLAPKKGIKLVALFPNKGESVELVEHFFKGIGFKMDYIIDSTNRWVKKFDARKTPQVFLVNGKGRVVYSGPIDDSVENLGQVKNAYLKNAVLDLVGGRPVAVPRAEGSGCWILRNR